MRWLSAGLIILLVVLWHVSEPLATPTVSVNGVQLVDSPTPNETPTPKTGKVVESPTPTPEEIAVVEVPVPTPEPTPHPTPAPTPPAPNPGSNGGVQPPPLTN